MGDGHRLQFGSAGDGFVGTGLEGAATADQFYDVFASHPGFFSLVGDHDDTWGVAEEAGGDAAGFESVYLAPQEGGSALSTPCENQNEWIRPKPWSPKMIDGKNPYLNRIAVNPTSAVGPTFRYFLDQKTEIGRMDCSVQHVL